MKVRFEPSGTHAGTHDKIALAYLAGLIDGEGSIGIYNYSHKQDYRAGHYYQLTLTVNMSDPIATTWCRETFGGSLRTQIPSTGLGSKRLYRWVVSAQKAEDILRGILPYLKTKKEEAIVGLKFRDTVLKAGCNGILTNILDKQEQLSQELKRLKRMPFENTL